MGRQKVDLSRSRGQRPGPRRPCVVHHAGRTRLSSTHTPAAGEGKEGEGGRAEGAYRGESCDGVPGCGTGRARRCGFVPPALHLAAPGLHLAPPLCHLPHRQSHLAPPPRDLTSFFPRVATVAGRVRSGGVDMGIGSHRVGWAGERSRYVFS
jgi:hypothetical protein